MLGGDSRSGCDISPHNKGSVHPNDIFSLCNLCFYLVMSCLGFEICNSESFAEPFYRFGL